MYIPCLRHFGDFTTSATLAAPHRLALFNFDDGFTAANWLRDVYQAVGKTEFLHLFAEQVNNDSLRDFVKSTRK